MLKLGLCCGGGLCGALLGGALWLSATILVSARGTDTAMGAPTAESQPQRAESVTLLVRGMMKSRSGAT